MHPVSVQACLHSCTCVQVVKQEVVLKLVPGGSYQLLVTPSEGHKEEYLLDPADWELRPKRIDEIAPSVSTAA